MEDPLDEPAPKQLTQMNILEGDPWTLVWANAYDLNADDYRQMTIQEFIDPVLEPTLTPTTPRHIRDLYEGARGAMAYGYYYYPLYMLGVERLFSTAEAAVRHRAKQLRNDWPRETRFKDYIEFLAAEHAISEEQREAWHGLRNMRNSVVHTDRKQLGPPGPAISSLVYVADAINELFSAATT